MKIRDYLKDRAFLVSGQLLFTVFIILVMGGLKASPWLIVLTCISLGLVDVVTFGMDYYKRRNYYNTINETLNTMEKKQYIFPLLPKAEFYDGKVLEEILRQTTKAMNDEIASYQVNSEEYREYIETWIHEVKSPIAAVSLLCDNNKSMVTRTILEENRRIEGYVEQALFYARSTNVEKDYAIRSVSLETMVKNVIKKHSTQLIAIKASIHMENLQCQVYTDPKWFEFILTQLVLNSIRYRKEPCELNFKADESEEGISFTLMDNGIGIPAKDLGRVFEKGFTGENGRSYGKSTGIGLYLCRQLCEKMGIGLSIKSSLDTGTEVSVFFPKDKFILLS